MLLLAALATAAVGGCTVGSEYLPSLCPANIPPIAAVTVEESGIEAYARRPDEPACTDFRPTAAEITRYLANAGTTDPQAADATLDRSPCQASGLVQFTNGEVGVWRVEQLGVGSLERQGQPPQLLYCQSCTDRPFDR